MNVETILAVALIVQTAFLIYREWYHSAELRWTHVQWQTERKDMFDRLMSRDFAQYKQATVFEKAAPELVREVTNPTEPTIEDIGM